MNTKKTTPKNHTATDLITNKNRGAAKCDTLKEREFYYQLILNELAGADVTQLKLFLAFARG